MDINYTRYFVLDEMTLKQNLGMKLYERDYFVATLDNMTGGPRHIYRTYGHNKCSKCSRDSCDCFRYRTRKYVVCSSCDLLYRDSAAFYIKQEALAYLCNYYVLLKNTVFKSLINDVYNYIYVNYF